MVFLNSMTFHDQGAPWALGPLP